jgi:hypothetical protein
VKFSTFGLYSALFPDGVKTLDGIMIIDIDYSRVQKLGGKHMQYHLDDYARRHYLVART